MLMKHFGENNVWSIQKAARVPYSKVRRHRKTIEKVYGGQNPPTQLFCLDIEMKESSEREKQRKVHLFFYLFGSVFPNYVCKVLFHLVSYSQVQALICSKKILRQPGRQRGHRKMPMDTQWKEVVLQFLYQGSDTRLRGQLSLHPHLASMRWNAIPQAQGGTNCHSSPTISRAKQAQGEPTCINKMER